MHKNNERIGIQQKLQQNHADYDFEFLKDVKKHKFYVEKMKKCLFRIIFVFWGLGMIIKWTMQH